MLKSDLSFTLHIKKKQRVSKEYVLTLLAWAASISNGSVLAQGTIACLLKEKKIL